MRSEHRECDPRGCNHIERLTIDGRFGQPETSRIAPEPPFEVLNPPADFRFLIAPAREREDDVVIWCRQRVAVSQPLYARVIGADHGVVDVTRFTLQPVEQRRSEIETQILVDRHQREIRFLGDAHIPIMLRRGRRLGIDQSRHRVFPRWLIEMAVDDGEAQLGCPLCYDGGSPGTASPAAAGT